MKTRDILITVTRILPGWHVYNDHQFERITAFDPQAGYEVTVNLPDSDTIRIVRTTARKAILATLQANRDDLRVRDTREWRFLTDEEFRRFGHAKPSDVSYAGDLDDYGMFDGAWRAAVDCGDALPHASEYSISGMLIAFDDKTVWETVCAGLDLLGKE